MEHPEDGGFTCEDMVWNLPRCESAHSMIIGFYLCVVSYPSTWDLLVSYVGLVQESMSPLAGWVWSLRKSIWGICQARSHLKGWLGVETASCAWAGDQTMSTESLENIPDPDYSVNMLLVDRRSHFLPRGPLHLDWMRVFTSALRKGARDVMVKLHGVWIPFHPLCETESLGLLHGLWDCGLACLLCGRVQGLWTSEGYEQSSTFILKK